MKLRALSFVAATLMLAIVPPAARAETSDVRIALGFGIGYLPLMVMEHERLLEQHAKATGIDPIKVQWLQFSGAAAMNDALLSGNLDFASGGIVPPIIMWAKTRGTNFEVKGVCALSSMPYVLNTRNPNVRTVKDFTKQDRIAMPAIRISPYAVLLQMEAEKIYGRGHYAKFDPLTVAMRHPDAVVAMRSPESGIDSDFTYPPFSYMELADPGVHTVLTSQQVLGGPSSATVVWAMSRFRTANPKTYAAFMAAMTQAIQIIRNDKEKAANIYLEISHSKEPMKLILTMLNDPGVEFTMTPQGAGQYAAFMHSVGTVKVKPASWKELYFPEVHDLPGS